MLVLQLDRHADLYCRFLNALCAGMKWDSEDPLAVMRIIRRTLNALYQKQIVDIDNTSEINTAMPAIMDRALQDSGCLLNTFEDSLAEFSNAIYALQLGN